jgi:hypothetical protein
MQCSTFALAVYGVAFMVSSLRRNSLRWPIVRNSTFLVPGYQDDPLRKISYDIN